MRNLFLLCLILFVPFSGYSQKRIKYSAEGRQEVERKNGVDIRYLVDSVVFKQENTTVYCDSAVFYRSDNIMEAFNNIRIIDDSTTITALKLTYQGDHRLARLSKNVIYKKGFQQLFTENLDYDLENEIGKYFNGGKLIDTTNTLTSKIGYYYAKEELALFYNDVVLISPDFTLKSDTLRYNTNTKIAYTQGPTTIINEDGTEIFAKGGEFRTQFDQTQLIEGNIETNEYTLDGDELFFDDYKKYYKGKGNVVLTSKTEDIIITGNEGFYDKSEGYSKIYGNPIMKRILDRDTFFIAADTMIAIESEYDSAKRILAYPDIRIYKYNLQGLADSAAYFLADSNFYMYFDPILWTEENQITADTIKIEVTKNRIEQMDLKKNAFLVSMDSMKNFNQIKGRNMIVYFDDNDLNYVDVNGNCESIFFSLEEGDSVLMGMNRLLCSNMIVRFENNEISNFSIYNKPEGRFVPPHEITLDDSRLDNFKWRNEVRPTLKDIYVKPDHQKGTSVARPTIQTPKEVLPETKKDLTDKKRLGPKRDNKLKEKNL